MRHSKNLHLPFLTQSNKSQSNTNVKLMRTRKMKLLPALPIALTALVLTSCSDDAELPETDNVTETTMDEVDVIDGTISDEMTDVDTV